MREKHIKNIYGVMSKIIILDNGHGENCAGKRSPIWDDGKQLFEWEFNRDVAKRLKAKLDAVNVETVMLVPEDTDISLSERCKRVNKICDNIGANNCILISIHANAGGGTGWECYTSPGYTKADDYATMLCEQFQKDFPDEKMRFDYSDGDPDKEEDFYVIKHTKCPAVLTENFFMDNEKDCYKMLDNDFRQKIAEAHYKAILNMLRV